jgi:hypothetical protein
LSDLDYQDGRQPPKDSAAKKIFWQARLTYTAGPIGQQPRKNPLVVQTGLASARTNA